MTGEADAIYYLKAVTNNNSSSEDQANHVKSDLEKLSPAELDRRRHFNTRDREALYIIAGGKCQICNQYLTEDWEPDHIIPYSRGGLTDIVNAQALCRSCNRKKGAS